MHCSVEVKTGCFSKIMPPCHPSRASFHKWMIRYCSTHYQLVVVVFLYTDRDALHVSNLIMPQTKKITGHLKTFFKSQPIIQPSAIQLTFVCVFMFVYVCICKISPSLQCQSVLSSVSEMEKEMLAPDSRSVLFLGRTYNYSNERIQRQHISLN